MTGGAGTGTSVTADLLIDLWASVIPEYRERGTWLMNSATWASVRKLKDSQQNYLVDRLGQEGDLRLLGRPVVLEPNMPNMAINAKSILFGDFSAYVIRDVGSIRIERSDDFAFANDLVTFRFIQRTDGDLVDETGALKHYANGAS